MPNEIGSPYCLQDYALPNNRIVTTLIYDSEQGVKDAGYTLWQELLYSENGKEVKPINESSIKINHPLFPNSPYHVPIYTGQTIEINGQPMTFKVPIDLPSFSVFINSLRHQYPSAQIKAQLPIWDKGGNPPAFILAHIPQTTL